MQTVIEQQSRIGFDAANHAKAGGKRSDNPYNQTTDEYLHDLWDRGFLLGIRQIYSNQ